MKIAHWSLKNGSGLGNVTSDIVEAEKKLGLTSVYIDGTNKSEWPLSEGADVHVVHSSFDSRMKQGKPVVYVGHGVPEHCFSQSIQDATISRNTHSGADAWAMTIQYCQNADRVVTFWPRHKRILQMYRHRGEVDCIPLGVDREFWVKDPTVTNTLIGTPAVFYAENCHAIKWPLDTVFIWKDIIEAIPSARLTLGHIPLNQTKWWSSAISCANLSEQIMIASGSFDALGLRKIFSDDNVYQLGMVRYGDFNKLSLEAAACGNKTISWEGNPYATFWITEGNQEQMIKELIDIFNGEATPRSPKEVPDIIETATEMKKIYEELS